MVSPGAPLGATLFVLALLVVLAKYHRQLAAKHGEEFRNIVLGIGMFGLISLLYLGAATGATAGVPFLSRPPFLEVVAAVLAITAVVLVASGASVWLPVRQADEADGSRRHVSGEEISRLGDFAARRLQKVLALDAPLSDSFAAIAPILRETLGGELCSLVTAYSERDVRRYTIGENGKLLTEKGLGSQAVLLGEIEDADGACPYIIADFERFTEPGLASVLRQQGFVCALVVPLSDGASRTGHLMLASRSADAFAERECRIAQRLQSPLAMAVAVERQRTHLNRRSRQADAILRLATHSAERVADVDAIFGESASVLRSAIGVAAVRIALFEEDGTFLRSRALSAAHTIENAVPADGCLIRSLMPLHRRVQETGESLVINQGEAEKPVSPAEAQQIYQSDLSSALVSPIKAGSEVLGTITLADRRGDHRFRFSAEDQRFVSAVAAILAQAVCLHETPWGALASRDRVDGRVTTRRAELRGRIRSSLTGILGSVEMLRSHPAGPDSERFMQIIDRSARRIETYFTEEEPVR